MVVLVSKISKGTLMDQIYIPKERPLGFELGMPVIIKPAIEETEIQPVYFNGSNLEPVKITIIKKIFSELDNFDNALITGSFLERGFLFNDIDVILIDNKKIDVRKMERHLDKILGLNFHIIALNYSILIKGLETDPLYQAMLSRYVAKKRLILKYKNRINYKLLDLHLLKSKPLIENFNDLAGNQKYDMTRNLIAIFLFLNNKKISNEVINNTIKKLLKENAANIRLNLMDKLAFLREYKKLYNSIFNKILERIKNGT